MPDEKTTCGVPKKIWDWLSPRKRRHHKIARAVTKARLRLAKAETAYKKTRYKAIRELDFLNDENGTECRNLTLYEIGPDGKKLHQVEVKRSTPRKIDKSEARQGVGLLNKYLTNQVLTIEDENTRTIVQGLLSKITSIGTNMTPTPELMQFLTMPLSDPVLTEAQKHLSHAIVYDEDTDSVYVRARNADTGKWETI